MLEPPQFASRSYWETRFEKNPNTFDWLQPATALDGPLRTAIEACSTKKPQVLHIGCGTSSLSFHLRDFVEDARQIRNLDFSARAIELGQAKERELFPDALTQQGTDPANGSFPASSSKRMRWSTADLLSPSSLLAACGEDRYDIVLDKGTSDALACGEDVLVRLPYNPLSLTHPPNDPAPSPSTHHLFADENLTSIHPVDVLALHLAALARPGAHWIALSYSAARFPFLEPSARPDYPAAMPDPALYWRLEGREAVEAEAAKGCRRDGGVFRPRVTHELYVLMRTEREV